MYCDMPDSPRRRATQAAIREIFDALCKLLAPILVFTAEEAWCHSMAKGGGSIHLQDFPQTQDLGRKAIDPVEELLRLRSIIGQAIEHARQEKLIGNTLEARVVLNSDSDVTDKIPKEKLENFFILSDLTIHRSDQASDAVTT